MQSQIKKFMKKHKYAVLSFLWMMSGYPVGFLFDGAIGFLVLGSGGFALIFAGVFEN